MKTVRRLVVAAGIVGAVALCRFSPSGDTAPTERPDQDAQPSLMAQVHTLIEESQELTAQLEEALQRCQAKEDFVRAVIARQLTLLEAATWFRDVNASWPKARAFVQRTYAGLPYEHALCRQVIAYAEAELRCQGSNRKDRELHRLEAELAEQLRQHGKVCLPGAGSSS
jgi:hypothetical protein